uniref:G_PROTEIN_RECEP_F1_2 domain-containing protein n=1 Tax=Parastrongyloides trichosuri TaxID=131310 RepID=A0A0N5A6B3_PARTI
MSSSAERRLQLENHINTFRKIAEKRDLEKERKWVLIIPALISVILVICQTTNTIYLVSYAYNMRQLYTELDLYFNNALSSNETWPENNNNSISTTYERLSEIDMYQESLWKLFVSEFLELILPLICLLIFGYEMALNRVGKTIGPKILIIYLLCPILTLILSLAQACMLVVTLSKQTYPVRYVINRVSTTLLAVHPIGRSNLESFFECEFHDTVDELPPCSGVFHDQVMPTSGINFMLVLHVIPFICSIYMLVHQLKASNIEHLFLHIETIQARKSPSNDNNNQLLNYIDKTLKPFETKFG